MVPPKYQCCSFLQLCAKCEERSINLLPVYKIDLFTGVNISRKIKLITECNALSISRSLKIFHLKLISCTFLFLFSNLISPLFICFYIPTRVLTYFTPNENLGMAITNLEIGYFHINIVCTQYLSDRTTFMDIHSNY